jgi:hypothetical protein
MFRRFLLCAFGALIVAAMPVSAQAVNETPSIGTLENGVYRHNRTGVEFTVPPDWVIASQGGASGGAQAVMLRDTVTNEIGTVWLKARNADPADIPALMNRRLDVKVMQRNNFEGYKFRSDSVQQTTIGGKPALSAVADYVRNGQPMVEYVTWVDGEKSRVVFGARMPASALPGFQSRFDGIIQSVVVP